MAQLGTVRIYPGFLVETGSSLAEATSQILHDAWRSPGFCVPNPDTYPHQWLWDSCFHALVWAEFSPERAVGELESALAHQLPSGFVPHMTYWRRSESARGFWGRGGTSTITQPPMYGHAVSRLAAAGVPVPPSLLKRAAAGLLHLLEGRLRTPSGLVGALHPWETGWDDSLRWCPTDDPEWWRDRGRELWRTVKHRLVDALEFGDDGTPVDCRDFVVGSVGFSALVAWNARELASLMAVEGPNDEVPTGDTAGEIAETARRLEAGAEQLADAVAGRWDESLGTWLDEPLVQSALTSQPGLGGLDPSARTLEAMLALLVDHRAGAVSQLSDGAGFDAPFGPRGAHRDQSGYDPDTYWRGPAWPQLGYLIWTALVRCGSATEAERVRAALERGAAQSKLAEFWNPDTGAGCGARPQTWAGLGLVAQRAVSGRTATAGPVPGVL